jgi:hypothetical protein
MRGSARRARWQAVEFPGRQETRNLLRIRLRLHGIAGFGSDYLSDHRFSGNYGNSGVDSGFFRRSVRRGSRPCGTLQQSKIEPGIVRVAFPLDLLLTGQEWD